MITQKKSIFIVGIKGVAQANLAVILKKGGHFVAGSDVQDDFITDRELQENHIKVKTGFDKSLLDENVDMVIYSGAHGGINNPLVVDAKKKNIAVYHQAEILGMMSQDFKKSIAVCGSHGKTTTSALLSYALINLKQHPSYMVGTPAFNNFWGGDYNRGDYFVVEADEYAVSPPSDITPKFNYLKTEIVIATNVDFDHPDVYKNMEQVEKAFGKFFSGKKIYYCSDDTRLQKLISQPAVCFGYSDKSNYQIKNPKTDGQGSKFDIFYNGKFLGNFSISLFGEKNISNASSVIAILNDLGFSAELIEAAVKNFTGAARRFEKMLEFKNTWLFDDYAHHPKEIETTIAAARTRFPDRRIIVLFQPHTYSRTQSLIGDFASALSLADHAIILPIFASARENPKDFTVTSSEIAKKNPDRLVSVKNNNEAIEQLNHFLEKKDIVFTMGAGDVYKLNTDITGIIKSL